MSSDAIVIVGGARTAIGKFGGAFKDVEAPDLAAAAIGAAVERAGLTPDDVDEVVLGQVGQVGPDAYNARRAAIAAGLRPGSTAMNVNRLCGSGLQAIVTAARSLAAGDADVIVAGGNESMSRQPFLDYGAREGWRLGHHEALDGTLSLLTDPFGRYLMGETAERVADRYDVSRADQDAFALRSQQRAQAAIETGLFAPEIAPVTPPRAKEPVVTDEHPRFDVTLDDLAKLKPVFRSEGTVTAGNASGINDGGSAVVMLTESEAARRSLKPRLRFLGSAVSGIEPDVMGYAPALAVPKVLDKLGLSLDEIDIVELNEAFAAQAVAVARALDLEEDRVNPDGGAIALGHPVGATGALLTVKLMHALERTGGRLGMVTMCIGGGQGIAAVFERIPAAEA